MNTWKISIKNIQSKPLYTFLSVFVLALSITLLLGIQQLKNSFEYQMENNLGEIDLVIGAKGSPLQLVLASILHVDNPTGNINYAEAKKISKNKFVKSAVPISYGDNYKGFRIVGTTHEFLSLYNAEIEKGAVFNKSMQVVIGSEIANQINLKLGDVILSSHGLIENDIDVHDDKLTVVGILKPTQKVIDRLIVTNLQSVWDVHDHEEHENHESHKEHTLHKEHEEHQQHVEHNNHEDHKDDAHEHQHEANHNDGHDHENYDEKEITSLLIKFRNPRALLTFPRKINKQTNMQAALPKFELDRLYEFTGVGFKTITWIAYLILIIAGITIFISLYKTVKERAFDLALLRTYGASNFQLIKMMIYEGFTITILAFILGYLFVKIGLAYMINTVSLGNNQNILQQLSIHEIWQTAVLVIVMTTFSVLLAIYPILKMNISTILSNEK